MYIGDRQFQIAEDGRHLLLTQGSAFQLAVRESSSAFLLLGISQTYNNVSITPIRSRQSNCIRGNSETDRKTGSHLSSYYLYR